MIAGGILLAAAGWAFTFGLPWGNFWVKIGIAVAAITLYSLRFQRPELRFTRRSLVEGIVSAAVLYGVFVAGNAAAPFVVRGASAQVSGIYSLGDGSSRAAVLALLLLVTGPGEEIFWRGFLQERLQRSLGPCPGFAVATLVYGGVHVFSRNPMLVLAALVAGCVWGLQYLWRKDLASLVLSHALWSAVIFVIAPVR